MRLHFLVGYILEIVTITYIVIWFCFYIHWLHTLLYDFLFMYTVYIDYIYTSTWKRRLLVCFGGQGRTMAAIGMFWRAMASVRHCPPKHATQPSPWREMAEDAVFWRPTTCSPPLPPKPANVGNLWRAMAVLGGSPSSSATPAILVAANGGSEYNDY